MENFAFQPFQVDTYISKWEKLLISQKSQKAMIIHDSNIISNHKVTKKSPRYQTIVNDVMRTRVADRRDDPNFEEDLLHLIVFYCECNTIEYKQGMNEIIGALYLMRKYSSKKIELYTIFNIFSCFIDIYFTNYFWEKELYALQSSISLVELLLKYHEPELYFLFQKSFVTSQVYATNWILTTYAK